MKSGKQRKASHPDVRKKGKPQQITKNISSTPLEKGGKGD